MNLTKILLFVLFFSASLASAETSIGANEPLSKNMGAVPGTTTHLQLKFTKPLVISLSDLDKGRVTFMNGQPIAGKDANEIFKSRSATICTLMTYPYPAPSSKDVTLEGVRTINELFYSSSAQVSAVGTKDSTIHAVVTATIQLDGQERVGITVNRSFLGRMDQGAADQVDPALVITLTQLRDCFGQDLDLVRSE